MKETSQEPCIFVCVEDGRDEEGERSPDAVAVVTLREEERRGWWRDHHIVRDEMTQVFVRGAVNDVDTPLMLDTGANISIVHTSLIKMVGASVRPFAQDTNFYGVSEIPIFTGCRSRRWQRTGRLW